MTVPMKRAYVRKDKSPEAKAVEFVKEQSLEDKAMYTEIFVEEARLRIVDLEHKFTSQQKQIDALNKSYAQLAMTSANHQNFLEKIFLMIEDSWSARIRKFMGL